MNERIHISNTIHIPIVLTLLGLLLATVVGPVYREVPQPGTVTNLPPSGISTTRILLSPDPRIYHEHHEY
jgi:hypothetical protein